VSRARLLPIIVAAVLVATGATATAAPPPIPAATAFSLPHGCVTGGKLTIRVRKVRHVRWLSVTITLDGKKLRTLKGRKVTRPIRLTHLPNRSFVLVVSAKARGGRKAHARRFYTPCGSTAPGGGPSGPDGPGGSPGPIITPPPSTGSYSGSTSQSRQIALYVSADGSHVQDVRIPVVDIGCAPTRSFYDQLAIASITIGTDGSFAATTTQTGVLAGATAHFTYTITGRFAGTSVSGGWREDIAYDNGIAYSCTSNNQTWTASRDVQGSQAVAAPPPGSYAGGTSQSRNLRFYVSNDRTALQDVSIPVVDIGCAPTNSFYDRLAIASIPVGADGAFSAQTTADGVIGGVPAHFTYTFSGHLHGLASNGDERVAGAFREDIAYDNGTAYTCTSNDQTWAAVRETQGTQSAAAPPGSYSGGTSQSRNMTFDVAPDGKHVQDVQILVVDIACAPTKGFYDQLAIGSIAIGTDGSFTGTAAQDGVIGGAPAHFTYAFSGHFHGTDSSGRTRVAGAWRETITYDNGTSYSCTSNPQTFAATRDDQGTQSAAPPPNGTYGGGTSQSRSLSFHVAGDGTQLVNVSIPVVDIFCTPASSFYDQLAMASITIATDGSFDGSGSQDGLISGHSAHFTYRFRGHFHGTGSSGAARASGAFREDITYDNGTTYSCTSNDQTWTATRTGP
jgi:hypothetical protein